MRISDKQFLLYYKGIILSSILLCIILKRNLFVVYFVTILLFIPSVINYFIYQLKFKDLLIEFDKKTDNIDLAFKTLEKNKNTEIEKMRQCLSKKVSLAFFSFFYIIFLLIFMFFYPLIIR